jgi:hypothetical protein
VHRDLCGAAGGATLIHLGLLASMRLNVVGVFCRALALSSVLAAAPLAVLWFLDRRERETTRTFNPMSVPGLSDEMRRGMNGLALQVKEALRGDPHAGDLYVFRGAVVTKLTNSRSGGSGTTASQRKKTLVSHRPPSAAQTRRRVQSRIGFIFPCAKAPKSAIGFLNGAEFLRRSKFHTAACGYRNVA